MPTAEISLNWTNSLNGCPTNDPISISRLWSSWKSYKGELLHSYTMLTINADGHNLMQQFHKPAEEKRVVVVLAPERYRDWLRPKPEHSMAFIEPAEIVFFKFACHMRNVSGQNEA
jgi:putative SOS response-associated peptidase YedK